MRRAHGNRTASRKDPVKRRALFLLALSSFTPGCGYHPAGKANLLPADLRTLAIPAFVNQTQTYRIEQMLTTGVTEEFARRTPYRITSDAASADAVLHGAVLSSYTSPLTYDSKTGRAATVLVVVSMRVSLNDRLGHVLYQNPLYTFREQYQISQELSSFFEEDSPAFERLSRQFARSLVSNILEVF
ncbi:MAG: LptE family protein [Acidobacteria bacterium]|nr:LptE family protein [Acidobacteriota bacterium]